MRVLRLIFLGPPGTGKGTQAQRLRERFGLASISSGDLLRREIRERTDVGRAAAAYVESGKLVPDEVITAVMLCGIDRLSAGQGFVLDGFPRTVPQAAALDLGLAERGAPVDAVIDFELDDAVVFQRIVGRRVCSKCGTSYNLTFLPSAVPGVCDRCGGALEQRVDDRGDVVTTRLETYRNQTAPLVAYYAERGLLKAIDASASADSVEAYVVNVVQMLDRQA